MTQINTSLINFGGKNDSPFEFYNTSDNQSTIFFSKINEEYSSFSKNETKLNTIFNEFMQENKHGMNYSNLMNATNTWFKQNITIELLNKLSDKEFTINTVKDFKLEECKLSCVFKYILTKDKGIGGFEQINSKRGSNVIKNYKTVMNTSRILDKEIFIETLKNTYFGCKGTSSYSVYINPINGKNNVKYSDYFMKGRKEGTDKTTKKYYNENLSYTKTNNKNFESVGKIILCLYDIITFQMASSEPIPESFDDKTAITSKKSSLIEKYINRNNLDVLFITEYLPGSIEIGSKLTSPLIVDYNIIVGKELDGLANAIVYKKSLGNFSTVTYPNECEFKEPPLIIRNNVFSMICYHAGGKGILENVSKFTETHLYKYINSCDNMVIVGGDFNCNIYNDCEIFGVKEHNNTITSFKKRTGVQPQFDKTNKLDKSKKDDFITKDCDVVSYNVTMINVEEDENISNDCNVTYLIPNNSHPFDHYFVNCTISLEKNTDIQNNYYFYDLIKNFISSFFQ